MMSIITTRIHIFKGVAEERLRVREFFVTLKTHWWPSVVFCFIVGLLSLRHIPHTLSELYMTFNNEKPTTTIEVHPTD